MKNLFGGKIPVCFITLFLVTVNCFAQKQKPLPHKPAADENLMHSIEETRLLTLINEMRTNPKSFASNNKAFIEKNYPEFYLRLTSSPKLEPLTEECSFANVARTTLGKKKVTPCKLPDGHTLAPVLTDESRGDLSTYTDIQLVCAVNFNLLEPDPNYIGLCLIKHKGIVVSLGNYQGEEHVYHEEIKEYNAKLAKKNIYLFQHMEPAIDRQLLLLINAERAKRNLKPLTRLAASKSNSIAGMYNSLYYNESLYGLKAADTMGALKSKSEKFAKEHSGFAFKGFYKKLTVMEHIVDTVTLARELFAMFMKAEKSPAFLFSDKQSVIGLNVNSSGSNFCLFATIAFSKEPEIIVEEAVKPLGDVEPAGTEMYKINLEVIRLVNELRKSQGLNPVQPYHVTDAAAYHHTMYMAKHAHFSHTQKAGGLAEPWDRVDKFKGKDEWGTVVENIKWFSYGYFPTVNVKEVALAVFTGWKNSPGHYKNMINPSTNYASVSGVFHANGGYFTYVGMQKR